MFTGLLLLAGLGLGADHPQAVFHAAVDISDPRRVPVFLRRDARYFDFSDLPEEMLEPAIKVFAGHVNELSRNAIIKIPARVTRTLVRVYLSDYHWKREVFESLKDVDPYFHTTVYKTVNAGDKWPGGLWPPDGKYYPASDEVMQQKMRVKKTVGAVQLHSQPELIGLASGEMKEEDTAIGTLILLTDSAVPILDAVWFFQQTAADLNRKPGYHDFLKFNNQSEFEALLGFNEKESRKFSDLYREAVARSKVITGKRARRIEIFDKPGGYYWRTKDSQVTRDKNNPLRVVNDDLAFDASMAFGPLPNGMMGWGLFNSAGVRQDRAPDVVAGTQRSGANNTMIFAPVDCIECHTESGVYSIRSHFRTLFKHPKGLESADHEEYLRLERQYLRPLEDVVHDSRTTSARAIFKCTGFKPEQWSTEYVKLWNWYIGAKVDRKWAARSLGTCPGFMQEAFARIKATTGYIDPVGAVFLEPESDPIAIDAWEEFFPIGQAYLRGVSP